jgi:site-specific recombinase XerD
MKVKFIPTNKTGVFYYQSTERNDRCYYITYKIGTEKKREKVGWKSEGYTVQIASDLRGERLQQLRHGKEIVRKLSFKEGMDKYLDSIREKPSFNDNKRYLETGAAFFGYSNNLSNISPIQVVEYIGHLKNLKSERTGKPLSSQTVTHHYNAIRQMYNYLIDLGLYSGQNPLNKKTRSTLPKVSNTLVNFLTDEELARVLDVLSNYHDEMLANYFRFALYTGIRRSGIFHLQKHNLELNKGLVYIPAAYSKSGQNEVVTINEQAITVVKNQLSLIKNQNIKTDYVFCNKDGSIRKDIKIQFATLKRKAGIERPFRFHDLRHNFASMVLEASSDLYIVQQLLNHKDPKTTQRYAHLKDERLKNAVNAAFKEE